MSMQAWEFTVFGDGDTTKKACCGVVALGDSESEAKAEALAFVIENEVRHPNPHLVKVGQADDKQLARLKEDRKMVDYTWLPMASQAEPSD